MKVNDKPDSNTIRVENKLQRAHRLRINTTVGIEPANAPYYIRVKKVRYTEIL